MATVKRQTARASHLPVLGKSQLSHAGIIAWNVPSQVFTDSVDYMPRTLTANKCSAQDGILG